MHTHTLADQTFGMCTKSTGVCNDKDRFNCVTVHVPWTINPMTPLFSTGSGVGIPGFFPCPSSTKHQMYTSCVLNKHPSWYVYLFIYLIKNATLYIPYMALYYFKQVIIHYLAHKGRVTLIWGDIFTEVTLLWSGCISKVTLIVRWLYYWVDINHEVLYTEGMFIVRGSISDVTLIVRWP